MKAITYNNGLYREYSFNGEENVVSINISDAGMLTRYNKTLPKISEAAHLLEENGVDSLAEADKIVKEQIDYIFAAPVSKAAFGDACCIAANGEGKMLFQAFFDAFMPVLTEDITSCNRAKAMTENIKTKTIVENAPRIGPAPLSASSIDLSTLTQGQKEALLATLLSK